MKKRFFSILLVLTLFLSLLPTMAMAADGEESSPHVHCICGAEHHEVGDHIQEEQIEFTAWTDQLAEEQNGSGNTAANSLPSQSGNYYLTEDVSLAARWELKDDVVLCLNGHDIVRTKGSNSNSEVIYIKDVVLSLTDCRDAGRITHAEGINGRGVYVYASDGKEAAFSMYAGAIADNHYGESSSVTYGAGVYVFAGSFTMYGGSIYGNQAIPAEQYGSGGGGVYARTRYQGMQGFAVRLYGGSIYGNYASSGGGVYVGSSSSHESDAFVMTGGSIYGNNAKAGGGLYIGESMKIDLSGGSITGNNVTVSGGGVYQNNTHVPVELSGNIRIIGNVRNGVKNENTGMYTGDTADNYRLPTRYFSWELSPAFCFGIGEGLEDTARVGVTALYRNSDNSIVMREDLAFAKNAEEDRDYSRIFICDQNAEEITYLPVYRVASNENNAKVLVFMKRWVVNFESNGGSEVDSQLFIPNSSAKYHAVEPANVTKAGYTLEGWYTSPDFAEDTKWDFETDTVTRTVTLYASWTPITYKLLFDSNGGEGTMDALELVYDRPVPLTANGFTRTGYRFGGWNTEQDGSGTAYADLAEVKNLATEAGTDVTLYAQWTVNQYTITFDTDGGTEVAPITQDYGTEITAPAAPTKTGYTFAGWDKTIPAVMPAEDLTVKAQWTVNQYTITFDTDGGTEVAPITQNYGTAITAPAAPTKTGYTFAGWDKTIPTVMPAENLKIKAMWEKDAEPTPEPEMSFQDVKKNDWFYDSVLWAVKQNITAGTSAATFSPEQSCTRGQMLTFLWRAAGEPKAQNQKNPFKDVKTGEYYYDAVLWAVEQGITYGTSETTFEPNSTCTRAESVSFLWRYYGKPQASGETNPFRDVKKGAYYYDAVLWAAEHGIVYGITVDTFAPNQVCTRAENVAFLYRAMK